MIQLIKTKLLKSQYWAGLLISRHYVQLALWKKTLIIKWGGI